MIERLQSLRRAWTREDAAAGLTTAVMLIPQAMAYAMLAGLPPIVGLYASTLPLVVYAIFGSSRVLAVGPVAMVSLLVGTALTPLAEAGSSQWIALAILLAGLVGLLQLGLGLLRAGFLVNFLGHPVVSGFTSAAALIIGFSQLGHLLGVDIQRSHHVHEIVAQAFARLGDVNLATLALGLGAIGALLAMKRWAPRWPRALVVVAASTLAVWGFGLHEHAVAIVGTVPAGLPTPALPTFEASEVLALIPTAIVIALVGFMESISVAKAFAGSADRELDPNKELVGLGLANLAAVFTQGYPVTGGFSRTAVNAQAGARNKTAGIVAAAVVVLTLLFFTSLFFYLPKAVLAAVIMTAVFGLVDLAEVRRLWAVDRADLALLGSTFVGTLGFGIEIGIGLGVGASLLWFVVGTTRPHIAVLGRLPGSTDYRNVERHPEAERPAGVLALRMDASFYFGNVAFLRDELDKRLEADAEVAAVVLDASGMNRLDSSAAEALEAMDESLHARGVQLRIAGLKGPVRDRLERSGLAQHMGARAAYLSVHDAVVDAPSTLKRPRRNVARDEEGRGSGTWKNVAIPAG